MYPVPTSYFTHGSVSMPEIGSEMEKTGRTSAGEDVESYKNRYFSGKSVLFRTNLVLSRILKSDYISSYSLESVKWLD